MSENGKKVGKQRPSNAPKKLGGVTGKGFVPGKSGNPSGRAKGSVNLWARVRKKLRQKIEEGPGAGRRYADQIADAIVEAAMNGSWPHTKELLDREHGKPAETTNHDGKILVEVVYRQPSLNGNGRMEHANGAN